MPTHAGAHKAIEERMSAQWADQSVAVRYENDRRKVPTGPYIHLHVRTGRAIEVGYSGGKILYRRPGWIVAQCFVERHNGTRIARKMADDVIDIFEGKQFSDITCNESEVVEVGDDKHGFYQINAKIFFDHDFERTT